MSDHTIMIIRVVKIFFVQFFCVFSPPLLYILISSASVSTISVLYRAHLCMKCSLGIFNFLEEISSLFHSLVFLISLHSMLRKAFLSLLSILWNSAFKWVYLSFSPLLFTFSWLFVRPPQPAILLFPFVFLGDGLDSCPVQCHEPLCIVHQALCLSDQSLKSISHFHCIVIRDLI